MLGLLITLAVYSVLVLLFVPLDKLAKIQAWIHKKAEAIKKKIES